MKHTRLFLLLTCLLAEAGPLFAVAKPFQQEKVYLHFDNTAYFVGENIWFKAYVVQAGGHSTSKWSKTLYVELVSPDGIILESKKLKLIDGKADGYFTLKPWFAGYNEIRAYTRFILNQGDDAVFSRVFACYDKPKYTGDFQSRTMEQLTTSQEGPEWRIKPKNKGKIHLDFFPEGGHLVEGLTSNVAFKAFNKDGKQATVKGVVVTERGDTVATLNTSHLGMGAFQLTPPSYPAGAKKEKLTALVDCENNHFMIPLPDALPSGYVLSVDNSNNEQVDIKVQRKAGLPNEQLKISVSCRGVIYGESAPAFTQSDAVSLRFPAKYLPSGVTQITLHSEDGRLLAQRLIFVNHHSEMSIKATSDKHTYRPYEPININFNLNDSKGKPVETELSLSVKDAATSPYDAYADNILTNLLLSSELRGHIEAPGYYFVDDSLKRRNDLDLLMLTQGWSRYDWKRVAGLDSSQFYHPYEESLLIEGNVFTVSNDKVKKGVEVKMTLLGDSISQRGSSLIDSKGRFNLKLEDFYGTSDLVLETIVKNKKNKEKRKEHVIRLDRVFSPPIKAFEAFEISEPNWPGNTMNIDAIDTDTLHQEPLWTDSIWITVGERDPRSNQLSEVQVNAKRTFGQQTWISKITKDATMVIDAEQALDALIDTSDWVPATVFGFLKEVMPIFHDNKYAGKNIPIVFYNNLGQITNFGNQDLIEDFGYSVVEPLVRDCKLITVKEGLGIDPLHPDAEAIIYVYMELEHKDPIGIRETEFVGYSLTKSFYSPPYDKLRKPDPDDVRRTLYWNPSVKTDANGKASVSFYNNRSAKTINISAETVTSTGMMGGLNQ